MKQHRASSSTTAVCDSADCPFLIAGANHGVARTSLSEPQVGELSQDLHERHELWLIEQYMGERR